MKKLYSLSVLLLLLTYTYAQRPQGGGSYGGGSSVTGKITGELIDSETNAPVEYATVVLTDARTNKQIDGTITDSKGQYKFQGVRLGTYKLSFSFIGYETRALADVELTPKSPDFDAGTLDLVSEGIMLNEVEVTAEEATIENRIDKLVYNADKDITTGGGDATDVLQRVPLLEVDLDGNVSLRGSSNLQILVNGKPSTLFSGGDIANALKSIPADQIKTIEVITTPTAKYDGEGSSGIINIITKKKSIEGFTGSVRASGGNRSNSGSLNMNLARGRFGFNMNASGWFTIPQPTKSTFLRVDTLAGAENLRTLEQNGEGEGNFFGPRLSLGAFYDINAYNSINLSLSGRGFGRNNSDETFATFDDPSQDLLQEYTRTNESRSTRGGFDFTTDYTKTFAENKDQKFILAFQVSGDFSLTRNEFDQADLDPNSVDPLLDIRNRNENDGVNLEYTVQADYEHPFSEKIKMETGAKTIFRRINSDFLYELYDFDQDEFFPLPDQSDLFFYDQDVFAGYLSFNFKMGEKWGAILGGRYEHTLIAGDFRDIETSFSNDYGNFLPSAILNYKLNQFSNLKIAYNQRIQRPSLRTVNPYVDISDPFNISFGNPDLDPELSHNIELGYNTFLKGLVLNGAVYYRNTTDEIDPITTIVDSTGITQTTFQNLGTTDVVGFNFFMSYTIKKIVTLRGGGNAFWSNFNGVVSGEPRSRSAWQYRLNLNATVKLPADFQIQLFGFYNAPRQSLQGSRGAYSAFSIGAAKEFWNKRASIGVSVRQPFNRTLSFPRETTGPGFFQDSDREVVVRSFNINFSYRFGKLDFRQRNRRSNINNDDQTGGDDGNGFQGRR